MWSLILTSDGLLRDWRCCLCERPWLQVLWTCNQARVGKENATMCFLPPRKGASPGDRHLPGPTSPGPTLVYHWRWKEASWVAPRHACGPGLCPHDLLPLPDVLLPTTVQSTRSSASSQGRGDTPTGSGEAPSGHP